MSWADVLPNLLIGLREGLEAGLVVSILLAALARIPAAPGAARVSSAPVWLGVTGAVSLSASFAAVLTFSTRVLSSRGQEAVGGGLSVLAVCLVTAMVFWMRRTARTLSGQLRGDVERAVAIGAGALTVTAFLAVAREGLETTLFLWAAVRASGSTVAPLVGAAFGLATAVLLCWLLYRRAVKINLGVFFGRTAVALVVIAAGVLSYGLGDLQDAGLLPGRGWVAVDLSRHVDSGSWWVSLITGVTDLAPTLTVLQVVAWAAYVGVVVPLFVRAGRAPIPVSERPERPGANRWEVLAGGRPWRTGLAVVAAPAVAAGIAVAALPAPASATTLTMTASSCAKGWTTAHTGTQTFAVANRSGRPGEINLDDATGGVVGEIETLGPGTTADLVATLGAGRYTFRCILAGRPAVSSAAVQVTGPRQQSPSAAVDPVTVAELTPPNHAYQAYAAAELARLAAQVNRIRADLTRSDIAAARADWLVAQEDWERVGASYDSFGDAGEAVDGLPDGLPGGVHDRRFTGLHRLEYGLWHGQSAAALRPVVTRLGADVATVRSTLTSDALAGDPTNLPLRAHEILEDALRDHLAGLDDEGSGAAYAETNADLQATRSVLAELRPLIVSRVPTLMPRIDGQVDALAQALRQTRADQDWSSPARVATDRREAVDGAIGALLESLSSVPDLLEVPPTP